MLFNPVPRVKDIPSSTASDLDALQAGWGLTVKRATGTKGICADSDEVARV